MLFKIKKIVTEDKTSKKNGSAYINQFVMLEINDEVRKVKIYRSSLADVYPVGEYKISPDSFRVNEYNQLEIGFLTLVPVRPKK